MKTQEEQLEFSRKLTELAAEYSQITDKIRKNQNILQNFRRLFEIEAEMQELTQPNIGGLKMKETPDKPSHIVNLENSGPGTVPYRFDRILGELEKRFPSTIQEQLSSSISSEDVYLRKIDDMISQHEERSRQIDLKIMNMVVEWCDKFWELFSSRYYTSGFEVQTQVYDLVKSFTDNHPTKISLDAIHQDVKEWALRNRHMFKYEPKYWTHETLLITKMIVNILSTIATQKIACHYQNS